MPPGYSHGQAFVAVEHRARRNAGGIFCLHWQGGPAVELVWPCRTARLALPYGPFRTVMAAVLQSYVGTGRKWL